MIRLFDKPKIIAVVGDVNTGKSNWIYNALHELKEQGVFTLFTYGLRCKQFGSTEINSIQELEQIRNAIIVCDEFFSLFDLEDRKKRRSIENTLRLIHHNNNILVLSGLPENFKKFVSAKLDAIVFKKCTIADFINGSRTKDILSSYRGQELGSSVIALDADKALVYDGSHYQVVDVPYLEKCDTKAANRPIFCAKNVPTKVAVADELTFFDQMGKPRVKSGNVKTMTTNGSVPFSALMEAMDAKPLSEVDKQ